MLYLHLFFFYSLRMRVLHCRGDMFLMWDFQVLHWNHNLNHICCVFVCYKHQFSPKLLLHVHFLWWPEEETAACHVKNHRVHQQNETLSVALMCCDSLLWLPTGLSSDRLIVWKEWNKIGSSKCAAQVLVCPCLFCAQKKQIYSASSFFPSPAWMQERSNLLSFQSSL